MGLNLESVRTEIYNIARLQANEPVGPVEHCNDCGGYIGAVNSRYARYNDACECPDRCPGCGEAIPPQDYRTKDSEGRDVCTFCYEELGGPQEAADARRDRETNR